MACINSISSSVSLKTNNSLATVSSPYRTMLCTTIIASPIVNVLGKYVRDIRSIKLNIKMLGSENRKENVRSERKIIH